MLDAIFVVLGIVILAIPNMINAPASPEAFRQPQIQRVAFVGSKG